MKLDNSAESKEIMLEAFYSIAKKVYDEVYLENILEKETYEDFKQILLSIAPLIEDK